MAWFRKRPVVIEARQVRSTAMLRAEDLPFTGEAQYSYMVDGGWHVYDYLHRTWVQFEAEDWIIRGIQGEFYPCKRDVFEATYDEAEQPNG